MTPVIGTAVVLAVARKGPLNPVRDQGIGIPAEELSQIFQPFYRARNARGHRGTAICLSLIDKIVRLHGGTVTVSSEEGAGTEVLLRFGKG